MVQLKESEVTQLPNRFNLAPVGLTFRASWCTRKWLGTLNPKISTCCCSVDLVQTQVRLHTHAHTHVRQFYPPTAFHLACKKIGRVCCSVVSAFLLKSWTNRLSRGTRGFLPLVPLNSFPAFSKLRARPYLFKQNAYTLLTHLHVCRFILATWNYSSTHFEANGASPSTLSALVGLKGFPWGGSPSYQIPFVVPTRPVVPS